MKRLKHVKHNVQKTKSALDPASPTKTVKRGSSFNSLITDEGLDVADANSMLIDDNLGRIHSNSKSLSGSRQMIDRLNSLIYTKLRHGSLLPKKTSKM